MAKVYIASDHAGFELKSQLIPYIGSLGHEVEDMGAHELDPEDDYPNFITPCAHAVAEEQGTMGVIIGGSGQGEAMAANRVAGIRAAVFYGGPLDIPTLAREHNDANILSLGARFLDESEARDAVRIFLGTPFSEDPRHIRRIQKY